MPICRPKAIADAPVFGPERGGGWRRGDFLVLREEWAKPRGRKSIRRRCGKGDRGAAVLWPDQAIRGHVARASGSYEGEGWRISWPAQDVGLQERRKRSPSVRKGGYRIVPEANQTNDEAPSHRVYVDRAEIGAA
jgi:hypothetical protein